jgi:hypothetical protein
MAQLFAVVGQLLMLKININKMYLRDVSSVGDPYPQGFETVYRVRIQKLKVLKPV